LPGSPRPSPSRMCAAPSLTSGSSPPASPPATTTLMTSRSAHASPLQAIGEISPGMDTTLHHAAVAGPWPRRFATICPLALPDSTSFRFLFVARGLAPLFLPTVGHPSAVAVRFACDGLLARGLASQVARMLGAQKEGGAPGGAPPRRTRQERSITRTSQGMKRAWARSTEGQADPEACRC
jgi:hypothetical protein